MEGKATGRSSSGLFCFSFSFYFSSFAAFRERTPRDAERDAGRLFWYSKKKNPAKLFLRSSPQSLTEQQHLPSPRYLINASDRRGTDRPRAARTSEAVMTLKAP